MIVAPLFDDDSIKVALLQHDVYYEAIAIIVKECRESARQAALIFGLEPPPGLQGELTYDHRVLQDVHDLLAAAWRYRSNATQRELELEPRRWEADPDEDLMRRWLLWLTDEVRSWRDYASLYRNDAAFIRYVVLILQNQNTPVGQSYEEGLMAGLADRFSDVPSLARRRELHEFTMSGAA